MKNNNILIYAIMSIYGMTKKEAKKEAEKMTENKKTLILQGFKNQTKKAFYED